MLNPQTITAFENDSISLRVAVYDGQGDVFPMADYQIDSALFIVPKLEILAEAKIDANILNFWLEEGKTPVGQYKYYVQIKSASSQTKFTVAFGTLIVKPIEV